MGHNYNLSLIFYPQRNGGYTVVCPELRGCITEGETIEEATENIQDVIADFLPEEIKNDVNEEALRLGLCMDGKMYQEIKVTVDESGEVRFPGTRAANVA
ncbi:MAG: type II toxin-antitoxin system HicB family antitoxin [Synergistaceae bacterium]|nr:type II toxin-antitoxin system HicB family antitoxin [Synergistaceae bacterium]